MAIFETHTGLQLIWEDKEVVLVGTRRKLLYPLDGQKYSLPEARKVFADVKKSYEARAGEEKAVM